jgi:excisionase family DNA binding protein
MNNSLTSNPVPPNGTKPLKRLVGAAAVADSLGVPRYRVYELTREKKIPTVRIGRSVRYDPDRIAAWIDAGGTSADEASGPDRAA